MSVHIPIAGLGLVPVMLGGPLILFPAHVVFLEFVIDPACSVAFEAEPEERDIMRRPPRSRSHRLLWGPPLALAVLEGLLSLAFVLGVYWVAVVEFSNDEQTRLVAFTAVIIANLSLIFFARAGGRRVWRHIVAGNRALWLTVVVTIAAYAAIVAAPAMRDIFRLSSITATAVELLGAASLAFWAALAVLHLVYAVVRRRGRETRAGPD